MSFEQRYLDLVSGAAAGPAAAAARAGLSLLSPAYAAVVRGRNRLFDLGLKPSRRLPRATVSVGNVTVGGTGKTPVIAHLARKLLDSGRTPAVLSRGYKARAGEKGDEQQLLEQLLGRRVPVAADPDRSAAAARILAARPDVDVFLLDDGFQHRRVRRDFDLVLIDATRPFGFGRVLPRGLLREPLGGLGRASAVLLTRCDHATAADLRRIKATISRHADAAIFRSRFDAGDLAEVARRRVLGVCGIGNPDAFFADLRQRCDVVSERRFGDHHDYDAADLKRIVADARAAGAEVVVTTGKDWTKLRALWPGDLPAVVTSQELRFAGEGDERALLDLVLERVGAGESRRV